MYTYLAEFIATLFFTYIVLSTGNPLAIGAAITFVTLLSYRFSSVTVNPAVTITMVQAGKLPQGEMLPYIASQIAGGLAALQIFQRV